MVARPLRTGSRRRPRLMFFAVFVLPLAGWAMYNSWDVPLRPEAAALMEHRPEQVPDADNLFLALLAFPISGEEPAHERGAAALAAAAKLPPPPDAVPPTYAQVMGRMNARIDERGVQLCSAGNKEGAYECLRLSRAQRDAIGQLLQDVAILFRRYHELERYPRYADPRAVSDDYAPDVSALRIAQLNLSVIALAMDEGSVQAGVEALGRSAALWRRVLAARDAGLIDKMVASRAYAAHLLFVSELVRERPALLQGPPAAVLEAIVQPLSDVERSLGGALASEFRAQARLWSQIADPDSAVVRKDFPDQSPWYYRLLVKRNDSIHRSYADFERLANLERQGCVAVRDAARAVQARPEADGSGLRLYEWFYNPIGRVLQDGAGGDVFIEFLGRQCNLLALQGMVGLQLESARSGSAPAALAGRFLDPNSGGPYVHDAAARTLGFTFIGRRPEFLTPLPLPLAPAPAMP